MKFSGIKKSKMKLFGSVKASSERKKKKWLITAKILGNNFARPDSGVAMIMKGTAAFLMAVRFHLSTLVIAAIILGSSIGFSISGSFNVPGFIISLIIGVLCHAAVSLSNEYSDEKIDSVNEKNRTIFSGGTGLLAKSAITKKVLFAGWIISTILAVILTILSVFILGFSPVLLLCIAIGLFFGLGYNFKPIQLSHKGMGEIAALLIYGFPLILSGVLFQVKKTIVFDLLRNSSLYYLSIPCSLAVFALLSLTQIPDTEADNKFGKKSISVILGPGKVLLISAIAFILCILFNLFLSFTGIISRGYAITASVFPLITAILIFNKMNAYEKPAGMIMLNIMGLAVNSAILCYVIPAIYFFLNPDKFVL